MYIIGISAFYHDSAACIFKKKVQLLRQLKKKDLQEKNMIQNLLANAVKYCLNEASISSDEVEIVVL